MLPLSHWISQCGHDVIMLVEKMEAAAVPGKKNPVTMSSFKVLEGYRVPEDYQTLLAKLKAVEKPTPAMLLLTGREILLERWWHWLLEHPLMPHDKIHPSRRMFTPPTSASPTHPPPKTPPTP